jgi:Abnormal spindle-like microcephaly-assoc'd, ASPM-SPD-2-Hydin
MPPITYTYGVHTPSWTTQVSSGRMGRSFLQPFMNCLVLLLALSLFYGCGAGSTGNSQLSSLTLVTPAKSPHPVASPTITVDPSTLPFGNTNLGSSNVQFVTVSNTGSSNLVISQSTASGGEFSIFGPDAPFTIAAGQSSRFVIRFAPTMAGGATGNISLVSNAENSPTAIALSGNGLTSPPAITVAPPSLTFGDVYVGASSARAVTISNTGSVGLVIGQATITGNEFSISGLTAPLTIASGESKSFNVSLLPAAAGNFTGNITLVGNGANFPATTIALAGSGVQPPTKPPVDVASVQSTPPELLVKTSGDGVAHVYSTYTKTNSTQYAVSDSVIDATLTNLGDGDWKIDITANRDLSSVYWPWQTKRTPLSSTLTKDIYYYPYILGMTEQASSRNQDWQWWGQPYPGGAFAPLTVMANDYSARIVAATNWPPKRVIPYYAAQRQVLYYDTPISSGDTASFSALIATVSGDAPHGNVPWQLAIDLYRSWLDRNMPVVSYPSWMISAQGFLDVQLENHSPPPTATTLDALWQPVKSYYPLVLLWGQMSAYPGSCCDLSYVINSSHLADVTTFTKSVVSSGYHAGYYSAPIYNSSSGYLNTTGGVSWLSKWITSNQSHGANSFYIDTLGRRYYGNPTSVLNLFTNGTIPKNSIIEGAVDIYPVAGLVSGALLGDESACGAPQKTPQNSAKSTYPQFGRYILRDRILFSGVANTDYRFWGTGHWTTPGDSVVTQCGIPAWCNTNGPCAYGAERLAFILGNKLDVQEPTNNPVLDAINTARINSNWMQRQPVFLNTQGLDLSHIPPTSAVRITLFQDSGGKHLIAISNPRLESGLTFRFNNQAYTVPQEGVGISILDLP